MENGRLGVAIHGAGWVAHAPTASWLKNPHARIVSVGDIDRSLEQGGRAVALPLAEA